MKRIYKGYSTVGRTDYETRLYDVDLVRRDLLNGILTGKGERVMLPRFGTGVRSALFEPFSPAKIAEIENDLRTILVADPRVELLGLSVDTENDVIVARIDLRYVELDVTETLVARLVEPGGAVVTPESITVST